MRNTQCVYIYYGYVLAPVHYHDGAKTISDSQGKKSLEQMDKQTLGKNIQRMQRSDAERNKTRKITK